MDEEAGVVTTTWQAVDGLGLSCSVRLSVREYQGWKCRL